MNCTYCQKPFTSQVRLAKHEREICKARPIADPQEMIRKLQLENQRIKAQLKRQKRMTKGQQAQSDTVKNAIIQVLLNSPLNIERIPDDVEYEMYNAILDAMYAQTTRCCPFGLFSKR